MSKEDFENMASLRLGLSLPRAEAEEYLIRLVEWHAKQGILLNGALKYAEDETAILYVLNNVISESLGVIRKDEE